MKFKSMFLVLWVNLLGFCSATIGNFLKPKIEDYLKGIEFERSFSPIEGKVIDINFIMTDKQYNEMYEGAQLSMAEYMSLYHGNIPDEAKYSTKISVNITVEDQVYNFEKVKLKLGGNSSKFAGKIGFNLKFNKQTFLGRNNIHLRADYFDPTHLRSKLAIDLVNKWNIPTVQETYANVYINGNYLGFYMLLDAIKPGWITSMYHLPEDEEVKTLYACEGLKLQFNPDNVRSICKNEKDSYLNYTAPLYNMIDEVYEYTTLKQLESKIDNVDVMRKVFIYEYLFGMNDNFIMGGNNYNFYLKPNGKWDFIPMDYSILFLYDFASMVTYIKYQIPKHEELLDYAKVGFEDWHSPDTVKPFIDILYYKNKKQFVKTLKELLITGFNPDELFERIDQLAEFIKPYVEKDLTRGEDGLPIGHINKKARGLNYTMKTFWDAIGTGEYYSEHINGTMFGLKKYIQTKFDAVCEIYGINKTEVLLKAKIYRNKRALEARIYDLNQEIVKLQEKMKEVSQIKKEICQQQIKNLLYTINGLTNTIKTLKYN